MGKEGKNIGRYDREESYCRKLGHQVPFHYCRALNDGIPCAGIVDCWYTRFDIRSFIEEGYDETTRERIFRPAPSKVETLFDLIAKAKERNATEE